MSVGDDDQIYFLLRERQARAMAERASDHSVQMIHLRFAEAYARRARAESCRSQVPA